MLALVLASAYGIGWKNDSYFSTIQQFAGLGLGWKKSSCFDSKSENRDGAVEAVEGWDWVRVLVMVT